ncbi:transglycosylase SLT domain-containing protein [Streptomyces sp. S1]|uniref:transglycosylase SLT domain-containing protein n=1 Tax=Streptomyces sp. S1 TaxID=718288 RepID=UPI003D72BB73
MATIRSLGFSIFSRYDGSGVRDARNDIDGFNGSVNRSTSAMNSWSGRIILAAKAASIFGSSLAPIAAVIASTAASATAMGVSVGTAVTAYGAAMKGAITQTMDAKKNINDLRSELEKQKAQLTGMTPGTEAYKKQLKEIAATQKELDAALKALSPTQKGFIQATDQMSAAWKKLIDQTKDKTLATATNVVQGLTSGIGLLKPIIDAVHPSLLRLSEAFKNWMQGDSAKNYANIIKASAVPALDNLIAAGKSVINVLGDGFRAFLPQGVQLSEVLKNGAAALKQWSDGGGFQRFLTYVREVSPQVKEFFGALMDALKNIGAIMVELGPFSLLLTTSLLKLVAALPPEWIDIIVKGFVAWKAAMLGLAVINTVITMVRGLAAAWFILNLAFSTSAIGLVIIAIAALVAGIILLVKNWDTVSAALKTAWNATWNFLKTVAETVWNALKTAWNAVVNALKTAWDTVAGALKTAWDAIWNALKLTVDTIWNGIKAAWNVLVAFFGATWTAVGNALKAAWDLVWTGIKAAAELVWSGLKVAWEAFINGLQLVWTTVSGALKAAWDLIWNGLKTAAELVWTGMKAAWDTFVNGLKTIWDTVSTALKAAWDLVWTGIKTAAELVWNGLKTAWEAFINALKTVWDTVSGALKTAWDAIWNGIKTAAELVWNGLKTAWEAFINALKTVWDTVSGALKTAWDAVWNALKTAGEAIWNGIKAAWEAVVNAFKTAWDAVGGALRTAWDAVWNAIKTAAEAIWNALKTAWDAVVNALKTAWDTVSGALKTAWDAAWNAIKTAAETIWNTLKAAWDAFLNAVKVAWDAFSTALKAAWDLIWNGIKTAAETIWNALKAAWDAFLNAVKVAWDTVSAALKTAWDAAWNAIKTAAETIWNALKNAWQAFLDGVKQIWDTVSAALKTAWEAVWNWVKDTAQRIWDTVKNVWDDFLKGLQNIWDTVSSALKTAWENTWNAVSDIAKKIWNTIAGVIGKAINGIIGIINKLIGGFNAVANFLGIDVKIGEIPDVSIPTFAEGGVVTFAYGGMTGGPKNLKNGGTISGYAPGRDTVPAVLSRGEGVLTPEAVRGLGGPGFVNSANRTFAGHRGAGAGAPKFGPDGAQMFAVGGMTAAALARAGVSLGMVTQGEYSDGSLSAGTHLGGGAVDIASTSPAILEALKAAGFAAWIRGPEHGMSPHIHAVLMNHPDLSPQAAAQVTSFKAGGTGLGSGGGGGIPGWLEGIIGKAGELLSRVAQGLDVSGFLSGFLGDEDDDDGGGLFGTGIGPDIGPDLVPGEDLGDALGKLVGGIVGMIPGVDGIGALGRMLLGLIPDDAFEFAFKWVADLFGGFGTPAGAFSKILLGMGQKLMKGVVDFLIGKNQEKSAEAMAQFAGSAGGGDVQQWSGLAAQALARAGLNPNQLPAFLALMAAESGGNPNAVNNYDSNARMGQPSQGLMQVIPSTFAAYRDPSLPNNIRDPLANMTAAARYILARYGGAVPGSPYADGTTNATPGLHLVGEEGPELITSPGYANFGGGETVFNATDTAALFSTPSLPASGLPEGTAIQSPFVEQMTQFPSAPQGEGWFGEVTAGAQHMQATVQFAWDGTVAATAAAQPVIEAITGSVSDEFATRIPQSLEAMAQAAATNWAAMTATAQAAWAAQLAEVYTPAELHMGTTMPEKSLAMQTAHDLAWTTMNATSLAQWTVMRDTQYLEAETHLGTTMPEKALAMQTAHDLAWTTMNATSLAQWTIMRDTQYLEAETHMGTTMPEKAVAMQTAHDLAWTTMQATSLAQWTLIRDGQILPFEEHMSVTMPEAATAMNEAVSAAFTTMVETVVGQLDTAIAKIQEFITATEAAIAAAEALAAAQASAAAAGGGAGGAVGGGGSGDAAAALSAAGISSGMIVQGPYSTGVAASGGTHDGGGVYDIASTSSSVLQSLIANGFAAWIRSGAGWEGNEHIHAVYMAAPDLSPQAAWQVQDFLRGGSGLGIPGNLAAGTNSAARGWTWVGEEGPELMRMRGGEQVMPHRDSLAYAASVRSWAGGAFSTASGAARGFRMSFGDIGSSIKGAREERAVNIEFNFNGPVTNGDDVRRAVHESIPKLRSAIQAGSGRRIGG